MTATYPFELILHHRYADRRPHDLSDHGNVGYGDLPLSRGRGEQLTAVVFDGAHSRVFVPPSPTLTRPGGVHASVLACVEELGQRRTLVEGYLSFALGVEADGSLGGSILGAHEWSGIRSRSGLIPLGQWIAVTFTYTSDGTMALSLDGELVAEGYRGLGEARGVSWPFGLNIGAWPDADQRVFKGRMEEVKLWRAPPSSGVGR